MHCTYNDAKDKNVAIYYAYATEEGGFLFSDVKRQRKLTKQEVIDVCIKNVAIELNKELYAPIHMKDSGDGVVVTVYNGTKAITFKSAEVVDAEE